MAAVFRRRNPQTAIDETTVRYGAEVIVRQMAPEELPFFVDISDVYFGNPRRTLKDDAAAEGPLRFGISELVDVLSIVALAVMSATVEFVVAENLKGLKPSATLGAVRRLFGLGPATDREDEGRGGPAEPPVPLTPHQLARVRQKALEVALNHQLPREKAEAMANAVVALLLPDDEAEDD